jgi:hypothetical protein
MVRRSASEVRPRISVFLEMLGVPGLFRVGTLTARWRPALSL